MHGRPSCQALCLLVMLTACSDPAGPPSGGQDRDAGSWRTWVIASVASYRPAAPLAEGSASARAELDEIVALQAAGTISQQDIERWDGAPTAAWTDETVRQLEFYWPLLPDVRVATPARAARILALVHVAIYDALVAAWDAKYAYERRPPYEVDTRVARRVNEGRLPSYPSEHAAAAAAAARVLAYAFPPEQAGHWDELARRAGATRIAAGVAYPSDVAAGLALGSAVGDAVVAYARADNSDMVWQQAIPEGADKWKPTPPRRVAEPFDPLAGKWRTWILPTADAFRPPPYPALGSAAFDSALTELRGLSTERTSQQSDIARHWATGPPPLRWTLRLEEQIAQRRLSTMRAARAHALLSTVMHDAMLACWEAKYHYWLARPITIDPSLVTVISTPPFPAYPSGHSTMSFAAYQVMAMLFPDDAATFRDYAIEASFSRIWGGIHYRFDVVAGDSLGARIGRAAVVRARSDGSGSR